MESFREENDAVGSERPIKDQLGNDTYIAPSAIGSEENLKARICDLEIRIEQEEKEIPSTKETVPRSNRRRKIRIYFPS